MSKDARSSMEYRSHEWYRWYMLMLINKANAELKREAQARRYGEVVT